MKYIKIGQHLINLENGHTFQIQPYSIDTHRIMSNGEPICSGSPDEISKAYKQLEDAVLNQTDTHKILEWIAEQHKVDADTNRYTSIKSFILSLKK